MPTEPLNDYCHACGMTEACRDSDEDLVRNKYMLASYSLNYEYFGYVHAYCIAIFITNAYSIAAKHSPVIS